MATSMEHAPPKCLFPTVEDAIDGKNYRKNLITVPSCTAHNSAKSHDDEYLLQVLSGSYTSSNVGLNQFISKVGRSFERSPSKAQKFISNSEPVKLRREEQTEWEDGLRVIVDGERLDEVLGNCARALYFHSTGKKFLGAVEVITGFTMYSGGIHPGSIEQKIAAAEAYFSKVPPIGDNPDVFWYKYEESDRTAIFFLCFYDLSPVLVRFKKIYVTR